MLSDASKKEKKSFNNLYIFARETIPYVAHQQYLQCISREIAHVSTLSSLSNAKEAHQSTRQKGGDRVRREKESSLFLFYFSFHL